MENIEELLSISEASKFLGVSLDTLRRWDKSGKLAAIKKPGGTHRYYTKQDLLLFSSNLFKSAHDWAISSIEIPTEQYCQTSAIFQARLIKMQDALIKLSKTKDNFSLIVSITGEIGDNSFAHNLGNWPDIPGVFYGYDIDKGIIILADRGLGILQTLKRVKPELSNHRDALNVAFTEILSGRAPEERGNGLKFVRQVIANNQFNLLFQSGDAELKMEGGSPDLIITKSPVNFRGCLAMIEF